MEETDFYREKILALWLVYVESKGCHELCLMATKKLKNLQKDSTQGEKEIVFSKINWGKSHKKGLILASYLKETAVGIGSETAFWFLHQGGYFATSSTVSDWLISSEHLLTLSKGEKRS